MAELYKQLIEDHQNLAKVLHCLEQAVNAYDDDTQETKLPLILDALEYIQAYPETFHHPLEEKAFDYLQLHGLGDGKAIQEIRDQHATLEKQTQQLCQQFNAIANDCIVPLKGLKQQFQQFVEAQKHHLLTENSKIFPTLVDLPESAWWDIASTMILQQDPLFREDPDRQQFRLLASEIYAQSAA